MISKYNNKSVIWVDLEDPSEEEFRYIIDLYSIPRVIEEEMRTKNKDVKTKLIAGFISTSFDFPQILDIENRVISRKIIFIISKDFICTIHDKTMEALSEFLKNLEVDSSLDEKLNILDNGSLFYYLIKSLYVNLSDQIIENGVCNKDIENQIIEGKNRKLSEPLYLKNQMLINLKESISSHEKTFKNLPAFLVQLFGDRFKYYLNIMKDNLFDITSLVIRQEKNINNLHNTYNLILTDKNNQKIKNLTTLIIISLGLSVLTFLYVFFNI
jgi:magnesium transporter